MNKLQTIKVYKKKLNKSVITIKELFNKFYTLTSIMLVRGIKQRI